MYTTIYIRYNVLISRKLQYLATCWSLKCSISQLLLHRVACQIIHIRHNKQRTSWIMHSHFTFNTKSEIYPANNITQ